MQQNSSTQNQRQQPAGPARAHSAKAISQHEIDFVPAPDEVARRAYFTYLNEGSPPGHDVQHWLEAESLLVEERRRTRRHGLSLQPDFGV